MKYGDESFFSPLIISPFVSSKSSLCHHLGVGEEPSDEESSSGAGKKCWGGGKGSSAGGGTL